MCSNVLRYIGLAFGALIYTIGLDVFLVPNSIIDGGVVGISLMAANLTGLRFGVFIILLNVPFFILGYKKIGRNFTIASLFSIMCLAGWSSVLHHEPVTYDPFLSTIFGGIIMGIGVGLIIRWGGSLDGTEILAIILDKKTPFSIGEIIMFFNLFILGCSGFVFSWDSAMYSLVAYFIAYKMIEIVTNGLDESKGLFIVTGKYEAVSHCILHDLGHSVTLLNGQGAYSGEKTQILYTVVSRLEITKMKEAVNHVDPQAFLSIFDVKEAHGGIFKNRNSH
jgi:uncharacterized membrane-anchored protein YitT (DUF2179 family)